jgi:DNA-binding transcriptional regulator GbsR (MarR family)
LLFSFFFEKFEIAMQVDNKVQPTSPIENKLEIESIDFFVRMMSILGLPRSVGEIYGVLYFAEYPLSMDEISSRLKISMGSTSQGLKTLRSLKAIRTSYVQGDRKDHYIAETEFRRLFSNFIKEDILPHLDSAADRISSMEKHVMTNPDMNQEFYTTRIEKLKRLTKAGRKLLPALAGLLKI